MAKRVKDVVDEVEDATDYIKPYEEPEDDELLKKHKKVPPLEFIKAVSEKKKDIIAEDPEIEKDYIPYIVNRGLGYFPDTVLHANQMNLYPDIPAISQYYFYMASIRKRERYSKWYKLEPNSDLQMLQNVYNVRAEIAKEYLKILTKENLQTLRELTETGENPSPSKGKKKKYK